MITLSHMKRPNKITRPCSNFSFDEEYQCKEKRNVKEKILKGVEVMNWT